MEDVNEAATGNPSPNSAEAAARGDGNRGTDDGPSIWDELRARRSKASRRIGEGWDRVADNAKDYADEHSIGVALGSLGVGIALGVLIGVLIGRD